MKRSICTLKRWRKTSCGPLSESWRYQPGTPAYCPEPTIQQLPLLLQGQTRQGSGESTSGIEDHGETSPDFPPQELVRVARFSAGLDTLKPRSWMAVLHLGLATLRT